MPGSKLYRGRNHWSSCTQRKEQRPDNVRHNFTSGCVKGHRGGVGVGEGVGVLLREDPSGPPKGIKDLDGRRHAVLVLRLR